MEVLHLLDASYRNIPQPWDQGAQDPKNQVRMSECNTTYPTVPMFNRADNFRNYDLDTLFFAFYYQ